MENIDEITISAKQRLSIIPITAQSTISTNFEGIPILNDSKRMKVNESFKETIKELKKIILESLNKENCNIDSDEEGEVLTPKPAICFVEISNMKFSILRQHQLNYIEHALNQREIYVQYEAIYNDKNMSLNDTLVNKELQRLLKIAKNYPKNCDSTFLSLNSILKKGKLWY